MSIASRIGSRLKVARERLGLTQDQLARELGLDHRQSLTAVEAGERRLSAEELLRAVEVLGTDIDYFTDAFQLAGEGRFSFRAQSGLSAAILDQFEDQAGRWIATYRELGAQEGLEPAWLAPKLALTARSSFEEAHAAAAQVAQRWELGDRPAATLQSAMERQLDALVLFVDAPVEISGACSQVPRLNAVLVNRKEPVGRRNYDLAHELFHLLTWDAMPPERLESVDAPRSGKAKRIEQLADNFAAALLMPEVTVRQLWTATDDTAGIHERLNVVATELGVSAVALKWRLHTLDVLSKADLADIDDSRLSRNGLAVNGSGEVRPFSDLFVRRVAAGVDAGRLSVKRAAALLGLSVTALAALFEAYDIEPSFEA